MMKMLTLMETLEIKLADSLNAVEQFESWGLKESADQWSLVASVLAGIIQDEKAGN